MTKDLENHGKGPLCFYLEPTCKKAMAQKMGRLGTGDDGSLKWVAANLRLKESGWPSKARLQCQEMAGVGTARRTHKSQDRTLKHSTHEKTTSPAV